MTRRTPHTRGERMVDRLAERLAEHGELPRAAHELGISYNYGNVLFQKMKRDLGVERCK